MWRNCAATTPRVKAERFWREHWSARSVTRAELFLIGERYEVNSTDEGKLFMHIIPSPWNNASSGLYRVRVTTEHVAVSGK